MNDNDNNNQNNNGNNSGISWANVREFIWIAIIIIGGWWGTVYTPIQEKFQLYEKSDNIQSKKIDDINSELKQRLLLFATQAQIDELRRELEKRIDNIELDRKSNDQRYASSKIVEEHREFDNFRIKELKQSIEHLKDIIEARRIEMENKTISKAEFDTWRSEREKTLNSLQERFKSLTEALDNVYSIVTTTPRKP